MQILPHNPSTLKELQLASVPMNRAYAGPDNRRTEFRASVKNACSPGRSNLTATQTLLNHPQSASLAAWQSIRAFSVNI